MGGAIDMGYGGRCRHAPPDAELVAEDGRVRVCATSSLAVFCAMKVVEEQV